MSYQALLFCPDEKTAKVVTQVLSELDFSVDPCGEPFAAVKKLTAQHFDAVVVDCENEQNAALLFKSARNSTSNQSSLAVAVVEGQAGVAKAFRIGANLVLTKPINVDQAKGTLRVARGLLRKGAPAAPSTPTAQTPSVAPPRPASPPAPPQFRPAPAAPAKPKPTFTAPPPRMPAPAATSSSTFEIEDEPLSEAAIDEDAAVEPVPQAPLAKTPPPSVKPGAKEYPWQPVSKPFSGPMASSLKRAAQAASDAPVESADEDVLSASAPATETHSFSPSASATASAPARAKQKFQPTLRPPVEAPVKQDEKAKPAPVAPKLSITDPLAEEPHVETPAPVVAAAPKPQKASGGGSKIAVIAAVVLLAVAAAGYFGWAKFHGVIRSAAPVQAVPAPSSSPSATTSTPPAEVPAETKATSIAASPSHSSGTIAATHGTEAAPAKSSSPKEKKAEAEADVSAPKAKAAAEQEEEPSRPEPIMVKNGGARSAAPVQESVSAPPPDALAAGNSGGQTIAGIVSSVGVPVPKSAPQTLRISQGVVQGMLMKRVQPEYPPQALKMRIQGTVVLDATIGKDGRITGVKEVSGNATLARAAIQAVKQWKYKPYLLNGQPTEIQTQVTVEFRLP
jgi:TonB family protein